MTKQTALKTVQELTEALFDLQRELLNQAGGITEKEAVAINRAFYRSACLESHLKSQQ